MLRLSLSMCVLSSKSWTASSGSFGKPMFDHEYWTAPLIRVFFRTSASLSSRRRLNLVARAESSGWFRRCSHRRLSCASWSMPREPGMQAQALCRRFSLHLSRRGSSMGYLGSRRMEFCCSCCVEISGAIAAAELLDFLHLEVVGGSRMINFMRLAGWSMVHCFRMH